jgi:endonuclease/exonuclease/phosphatase family metal-dependent hydrolase
MSELKLSILQWNTWYKEENQNIVSFLKAHPADVICLQELTIEANEGRKHLPRYIAEQLGYEYYFKEIDHGEGKINIANGIFSKYPITNTDWQWINEPTGTGHYDDEYRAYVEATLNVNGIEVTVATTHMSYTNAFINTPRKEQEVKRLTDILKTKKGNFVFTGDLNATPGSPTIQAISDVLQNAGPADGQNTWTTKPFSYDSFEETKLNWRLDYVFTTKDIEVIDSVIPKTDCSDHLPIITRIQL